MRPPLTPTSKFRTPTLPTCLPLSHPPTQAKHALNSDPKRRYDVFAISEREIKMVTYQNLWNRFRAGELALGMSSDRDEEGNRRSSTIVDARRSSNILAETPVVLYERRPSGVGKSGVAVAITEELAVTDMRQEAKAQAYLNEEV